MNRTLSHIFTFQANNETLEAQLFAEHKNIKPQLLMIHGAGTSDKHSSDYLSEALLEMSIPSLSFDHSGHGQSTNDLKNGSLKKRVEEAQKVLDFLDKEQSLSILGASMGGYVAMKLLQYIPNIQSLILFCPAMYHKDAYDVQFNHGFTDIIRQPESWKQSDILPLLEKYTGNIVVVIGENDEVIPDSVIELIDKHTPNVTSKKIIKIPNCPHKLHTYLRNNAHARATVIQFIQQLFG